MRKLIPRIFKQLRIKFIIITSVLFLIFSALVLSIWFYTNQNYAKKTSEQNMNQVLNASTSLFENQLMDVIHILSLISVRTGSYNSNAINILTDPSLTDAEILKYRKEASEFLIKLCSNKNYLNGLEITNFSDKSITYGITTPYETLEKLGLHEKLSSSGTEYFFIVPHINEKYSTRNQVFSIIKPVLSHSGTLAGYVIADLKCSLIDDIYGVQNDTMNSIYIIDSKNQETIYEPSDNPIRLTEYLNSKNNTKKIVSSQLKSVLTDWTIISAAPVSRILQDFYDAQAFIIALAVLFLFLFLGINLVLINQLTKNIRLLTSSVNQINEDCLKLNIEIHSDDEVGTLYTRFQAMLSRINELIQRVKDTEHKKRTADLRVLQAQINPHFLYNTLNTIKFLAVINGNQNIAHVSESLTGLMRTNMQPAIFISLTEEKKYLQNYLEIQKYHYTFPFEYEISLPESLENYYIPKMLLQPLVENSLKHGYNGRIADNWLSVIFCADQKTLCITVKDNGIGMSREQINLLISQTSEEHIGIVNIRQRILLYFGSSYSVSIKSKENEYTQILLKIPLITKEEVTDYV